MERLSRPEWAWLARVSCRADAVVGARPPGRAPEADRHYSGTVIRRGRPTEIRRR